MVENSIYVLSFILILTTVGFVFAGAKALSIMIKELNENQTQKSGFESESEVGMPQQLQTEFKQIAIELKDLQTQIKNDLSKIVQNREPSNDTQNEVHLLFEKLRIDIMQEIGQTVSDAVLSRVYFDKAAHFFNNDQIDIAIELLNQTIQLNPKDFEAFNLRGAIYFKQNEFDKAVVDYSKAIEINPYHKTALYNRGVIYRDVFEDYEKALEDSTGIIKLTPDDANAYHFRATVYAKMNKDEEAIRDYSHAKELDPKFANRRNIPVFGGKTKSLQEIVTTFTETLEEHNVDTGA